MHRVSDIAKLTGLYSDADTDALEEAMQLTADPEIMQTINNLGVRSKGRGGLQKTGRSNNIAATTKDMRDIARTAHRLGLNRQMKPAQFKLLDPRGTHIISPQFFHDRADGKLVDMHVRCHVHLKLLGKQKAVELLMDVPMESIVDYLTGQEKLELMDKALSLNAVERTVDDDGNVLEPSEQPEPQMIDLSTIKEGNEMTPNADKLRAEGNA